MLETDFTQEAAVLSSSQAAKRLKITPTRLRQMRLAGEIVAKEPVLSADNKIAGWRYEESEVERVRRIRERIERAKEELRKGVVA